MYVVVFGEGDGRGRREVREILADHESADQVRGLVGVASEFGVEGAGGELERNNGGGEDDERSSGANHW